MATSEKSFTIRINVWKMFAFLALAYIVPISNPIQSLPWWVITIPLWAVPFFWALKLALQRTIKNKTATPV